jgi:hypothetical protein
MSKAERDYKEKTEGKLESEKDKKEWSNLDKNVDKLDKKIGESYS